MEINIDKPRVMRISKVEEPSWIIVGDEDLENSSEVGWQTKTVPPRKSENGLLQTKMF